MRSPSRLPQRSSRVVTWGAAAITAAALYALPALALAVAIGGGWAIAALAACLAVLVFAAVRLWSPLVVLAAAITGAVGAVGFVAVTSLGEACGTSTLAHSVEIAGGIALAIPIGAWGVRRRAHVLWALPAGWLVAAGWYVAWAHVIPGGTGGCFE